jgi:hypothetical protein
VPEAPNNAMVGLFIHSSQIRVLNYLLDTMSGFETDVTPVISAGTFRRANGREKQKKVLEIPYKQPLKSDFEGVSIDFDDSLVII